MPNEIGGEVLWSDHYTNFGPCAQSLFLFSRPYFTQTVFTFANSRIP